MAAMESRWVPVYAALLRFVQPDTPTTTMQYGRGRKRQAPVVQEFMHYLAGGDKWSALLCGPGRTCKRHASARGLLAATRGDCMGGQLNLKPNGIDQ